MRGSSRLLDAGCRRGKAYFRKFLMTLPDLGSQLPRMSRAMIAEVCRACGQSKCRQFHRRRESKQAMKFRFCDREVVSSF